jgi:hypothetical protein
MLATCEDFTGVGLNDIRRCVIVGLIEGTYVEYKLAALVTPLHLHWFVGTFEMRV